MALSNKHFDYIRALVEQLEQGDNFDVDLETFIKYAEELRTALYRMTANPEVLRKLNAIRRLEVEEESPGLWGMILPKSTFGMYDRYQKREKLLVQVRDMADTFAAIQFILQDKLA